MATTTKAGRREDVTVYLTPSELSALRRIQAQRSTEFATASLSSVCRSILVEALRSAKRAAG